MLRGFPSSFRRKPESRGGRGGTNHTKSLPPVGTSIFIPWYAGASRDERLVRKWVVPVESPPNSSFPRKRESRGGVWVANDPQTPPPVSTSISLPWCAGASRHPDYAIPRHESMSRTTIRDSQVPARHSGGRKHAPCADAKPESTGDTDVPTDPIIKTLFPAPINLCRITANAVE